MIKLRKQNLKNSWRKEEGAFGIGDEGRSVQLDVGRVGIIKMGFGYKWKLSVLGIVTTNFVLHKIIILRTNIV